MESHKVVPCPPIFAAGDGGFHVRGKYLLFINLLKLKAKNLPMTWEHGWSAKLAVLFRIRFSYLTATPYFAA
jgi:hypothetical protein